MEDAFLSRGGSGLDILPCFSAFLRVARLSVLLNVVDFLRFKTITRYVFNSREIQSHRISASIRLCFSISIKVSIRGLPCLRVCVHLCL